MDTLLQSRPFVIAHNLETVERLTPIVRDRRASYRRSLEVLKYYKKNDSSISTKSSLMLGLGEKLEEIYHAMSDLVACDVDIITFGQYLMPSRKHLKVEKYYTPEEFEKLKEDALNMGLKFVASGPLVRSSYKASDYLAFIENKAK